MNGNVVALVIAIVGVIGTLSASVISQRLAARSRREELEQERLHRRYEAEREQTRSVTVVKRSCYISITATSRRYRIELMNYLYAVKRGEVTDVTRIDLEEARRAYNASYAETQMTGTAPVLSALHTFNKELADCYRYIMRLEHGDPEAGWPFDKIREFMLQIWTHWYEMRTAMREDLGVID